MPDAFRGEYHKKVYYELCSQVAEVQGVDSFGEFDIIEGCCKNSADEFAEGWAEVMGFAVEHHPATKGSYLKRNMEMVAKCDEVLAFWDGYSYGTAFTIAHAVAQGKSVRIVMLKGAV